MIFYCKDKDKVSKAEIPGEGCSIEILWSGCFLVGIIKLCAVFIINSLSVIFVKLMSSGLLCTRHTCQFHNN